MCKNDMCSWCKCPTVVIIIEEKLFSCHSSQVTKLCDLASDGDSVTSVSWSERV